MSGEDLLDGVRVLDFSRVMAGPYCTALLADLGADVIKVEPPAGDDYRHIGPFKDGESALFMLVNRGKRGITLNLKSPDGLDLARRLAEKADVVVENFKPGVAARLGIGEEELRRRNPRLVYASISGFGQEGPLADRPAYDIIAQATSGIMDVTGMADGPPTRVGESIGDLCAALYAAWAVVAALFARERTGEVRSIDIGMFDALFSFLPTPLAQHLFGASEPKRVGNRHPLSTPFGSFRARDGHVIIAVANDRLFARLAAAIGRPELADDPRFARDEARTEHEPELRAIIEDWTRARDVEAVVEELSAAGIPCSEVWSVARAAESAHVAFRELLAPVSHPAAGDGRVLRQPVRFGGSRRAARPSPLLGEHTEAVLADALGLGADEIARLRETGAF